MATTHFLEEGRVHYQWDRSLAPALEIAPGDTVVYRFRDVTDGQVHPGSKAEDLGALDWNRIYPLAGPVFVKGAKPGDVLEIEVLDLHPLGWGWSAILPGFGLLEQEFTKPYLHHWDLSNGTYAWFKEGIRIPLDPFCGTMGVAPAEPGPHPVMPAGKFGGNMDIRHLTAGSRLYLPVQVEGALFSAGDCHAAQGDGEVCVTAIECPMYGALRFHLHHGTSLPGPQFQVPGPLTSKYDAKGYYATTGISTDLMEAARQALRNMIAHMVEKYGLTPEEAYVLSSIVVDLKVSEVVDKPHWIISAYLPLAIFV